MHRASEGVFYICGRGLVSQIIELVTFARCAFIFALCNIALRGYLDTRRNILEHLRHDVRDIIGASLSEPHLVRTMISLSVYIYIYIYIIESVDSISRDERDFH